MIDREGTINNILFLEEEAKEDIAKSTREELLKTRLSIINTKWTAIANMYKSLEEIDQSSTHIGIAIGKVELCYKLKYISKKVYTEITNYLRKKEQGQEDYKSLYTDLLQLYHYEVEQANHWRSQWKEAEDEFEMYFE